MDSIIVALITGTMSIIGVIITVTSSGKKQRVERQEDLANQQAETKAEFDKRFVALSGEIAKDREVTNTKIDALKSEVEKHNGVVERTFKLEEQNKTLFEQCKSMSEQLTETSERANHAAERADAAHNRIDRAGITSGLS